MLKILLYCAIQYIATFVAFESTSTKMIGSLVTYSIASTYLTSSHVSIYAAFITTKNMICSFSKPIYIYCNTAMQYIRW